MQTITEMALLHARRDVFTRAQASLWVQDRGSRLDALLKRSVAAGEVWRIRRGLFTLSRTFSRRLVEPMLLAQVIHGPSYISLETALSHHGWIPDAVYTLTSASTGRSRTFRTPVGVFSYTRIPQTRFLAGVRQVELGERGSCMVATPLKALADLVYVRGYRWRSTDPVRKSLRVEADLLAGLTGEMFDEVESAYRPGRVTRFLAGLREELGA